MKQLELNENIAHIGVQKSRMKEYDAHDNYRTVYLKDGDEFQIELFNPYHTTVGVSITFDEKCEDSNLLVLKPGERVWLERYLGTPNKFKFSTYSVEDTAESKKAISENGNVIIRFYREQERRPTLNAWNKPHDWNIRPWNDCQWHWNNNTGSAQNTVYFNDNCSGLNTIQTSASFDGSSIKYCSCDYSFDNDGCANTLQTSASTIEPNMLETGRVEQGGHSEQSFNYVNKDFETYPFKTEYFKLLPVSRKPITKSDITKKYCYNCGRKLKEKFKFCPFCGAEQ